MRSRLLVAVTTPNSGTVGSIPGLAKTGLLNALKNSARNISRMASRIGIGKERKTDRSKLWVPSVRRILRSEFPNVNCAGTANAALLNHWLDVGFERCGSPARLR